MVKKREENLDYKTENIKCIRKVGEMENDE